MAVTRLSLLVLISRTQRPFLVELDIVVADRGHPDQGRGGQAKGKELGHAKRHALEDEELAGKVAERDDVGPDGNVVDGANVQVVGGVAADDAGDERPGAKEASGERRQLVGRVGILRVARRHELVGAVLGVAAVGSRLGELRVGHEAAVVDAPRKVQRQVRL